jgi:hypothetical protein
MLFFSNSILSKEKDEESRHNKPRWPPISGVGLPQRKGLDQPRYAQTAPKI